MSKASLIFRQVPQRPTLPHSLPGTGWRHTPAVWHKFPFIVNCTGAAFKTAPRCKVTIINILKLFYQL